MKKGIVKKILLGFLGLLALLVIVFVVSCNVRLPELEETCKRMEDRYFEYGYTNIDVNRVIVNAYTYGNWDNLYKELGTYISFVVGFSPMEKQFLRFSSVDSIKKYWKYL